MAPPANDENPKGPLQKTMETLTKKTTHKEIKFAAKAGSPDKSNQSLQKEWWQIKNALSPPVIKKGGLDMAGMAYIKSVKVKDGCLV